jgi:membrane protease YdiL (CAAX protease family)
MALPAFAVFLALWGLANLILATRFRRGHANYLLTYRSGWLGERGKRSLPYGLYPISAILLISAADAAAQAAGAQGLLFDGGYLLLLLVLIVVTVIFMVTKPSWLATPNTPERTAATTPDDDPAAALPRPLDQMSVRELKKWIRANPEQAHRLAHGSSVASTDVARPGDGHGGWDSAPDSMSSARLFRTWSSRWSSRRTNQSRWNPTGQTARPT